MNAIATCTLPDDAEPPAQQMQTLTDLIDHAMSMARLAVEQYEALVHAPADAIPPRRQPDPGSLFVRFARIVLNGIAGQSRLAAGLPLARFAPPPLGRQNTIQAGGPNRSPSDHTHHAAQPTPVPPLPEIEPSSAEPVRQALRTATRNHPRGAKLFSAGLEKLAATLTADPHSTADLPALFRRICDQAGIHLNPSEWRRATRDLIPNIRAAPA